MNKLFKGYIPYNEDELDEMWKNSIIAFDANVLLNLYRYSKETQEKLLNLFDRFNGRVWLPHQSAKEYFRNRKNVIAEQQNMYRKIEAKLCQKDSRLDILNSPIRHLYINSNELLGIINLLEDQRETTIKNYLKERKDMEEITIFEDSLLNRLITLFEGNVGKAYNEEENLEKCSTAKARYKYKIPPGYEDLKDKSEDPKEVANAYGDYILWSQIIDYAKSENVKSILLITDDNKEDWFGEISNIKIGPRSELIQEFYELTGKNIWIYSSDKFIEYAAKYLESLKLKENLKPEIYNDVIEEVINIKNSHYYDFLENDYTNFEKDLLSSYIKYKNVNECNAKNNVSDFRNNYLIDNFIKSKFLENKYQRKNISSSNDVEMAYILEREIEMKTAKYAELNGENQKITSQVKILKNDDYYDLDLINEMEIEKQKNISEMKELENEILYLYSELSKFLVRQKQ